MSRALSVLLIVVSLSACGTLPSGEGWGEDATFTPGWERVHDSAVNAARDPWVWGPLIGAAAFQIDDWDRRTSDWAREHTPVFGSQRVGGRLERQSARGVGCRALRHHSGDAERR